MGEASAFRIPQSSPASETTPVCLHQQMCNPQAGGRGTLMWEGVRGDGKASWGRVQLQKGAPQPGTVLPAPGVWAAVLPCLRLLRHTPCPAQSPSCHHPDASPSSWNLGASAPLSEDCRFLLGRSCAAFSP